MTPATGWKKIISATNTQLKVVPRISQTLLRPLTKIFPELRPSREMNWTPWFGIIFNEHGQPIVVWLKMVELITLKAKLIWKVNVSYFWKMPKNKRFYSRGDQNKGNKESYGVVIIINIDNTITGEPKLWEWKRFFVPLDKFVSIHVRPGCCFCISLFDMFPCVNLMFFSPQMGVKAQKKWPTDKSVVVHFKLNVQSKV